MHAVAVTGPIPDSIGNLENLVELNLSHNHFSGTARIWNLVFTNLIGLPLIFVFVVIR